MINNLYEYLTNTTLDAYFVLDSAGRFLEANAAATAIYGYSRDELLDLTIRDIEAQESHEETLRHISILVETGYDRFESRHYRKDGSIIDVEISVSFVTETGTLLAFSRDISERKRQRAELQYVRECFIQALKSPTHVLYRLNVSKGCYDYISPAFGKITGYRLSEYMNNSFDQVKGLFHPDDRVRVFAALDEACRRRIGDTVSLELEYRIRKADGTYCWLYDSTTACFNVQGELDCFFGLAHDITKRKEAENALLESECRLNRAQSIAKTGCWELSLPTGQLVWSDEIFRIFELDRSRFAANYEAFLAAIHPDDRDTVNAAYRQALASNTKYSIDHRLLFQNGRVKWVHEECETSYDDVGNPLTSLGTVQDITERKEAEMAIKHLNEHLEELVLARTAELSRSNEDLGMFCHAVSHELRAPIGRLIGFSSALAEEGNQSERVSFLTGRITAASKKLQEVVDAILVLSRLNRQEIVPKLVDLSEMIKQRIRHLLEENPDRRVEVAIAPGIKAVADPHLIGVCLDNLISNAFKYTGQTADARIEFGMVNDSGKNAYFVRDNGAGFDMARADKLYTPFQRLHLQDDFPGIGIGLATVKKIIERHGGEIWAKASVGEGATFFFTLGQG